MGTPQLMGWGKFIYYKSSTSFVAIIVVVVNKILEITSYHLVNYTKPGTISDRSVAMACRVYKLQIFNSAITPFINGVIACNFFGKNGFLDIINFFLVINMFVDNLLLVFDPIYFMRLWKVSR